MIWRAVWWTLCGLVLVAVSGAPVSAQTMSADRIAAYACRDAAAQVEQEYGLPAGLMLAIGRQESGRRVPETGEFLPFPFAVDAAGESRFFASEADAIAYVLMQRSVGVQSIDVGCFQINLRAHPGAFATLHDGFDPVLNGRYAAGFLRALREQGGSWQEAVARYHSGNPVFGAPYMASVLRRWDNAASLGIEAGLLPVAAPAWNGGRAGGTNAAGIGVMQASVSQMWQGSLAAKLQPASPNVISVMARQRIGGILVQRPGDTGVHVVAVNFARRGMPGVVHPGG